MFSALFQKFGEAVVEAQYPSILKPVDTKGLPACSNRMRVALLLH
jgi:hypothetical protein